MNQKFEYLHERDPKRIIEAALRTIGIENTVVHPSNVFDDISATDWFELCALLHISTDSYSYGYCRQEHRARIRAVWETGDLVLPRTPGLRALLKEVAEDRRRDRRWRDEYYGLRLRWKVRWQDFKTELRLLPKRWRTEARVWLRDFRAPKFSWEPRELLERAS